MLFFKRGHFPVAFVIFSLFIKLVVHCPSTWANPQDNTCQTLLQGTQTSDKDRHWSHSSNVFAETLPVTLLNTVAWLSAVEGVRQLGFSDHPAVTSTFLRTVPTDATLTALSHAIALGHLPWLKRFLSAEGLPQNLEFWARTGANGLISTAVISTTWAVTGIPVTGEHLAGAFALCAAVYPTLQTLKSFLFKVFPYGRDGYYRRQLQVRLPDEMSKITANSEQRAQDLGLNHSEIVALFLASLESLITSKPYENDIATLQELQNNAPVQKLLKKIQDSQNKPTNLMKWRRKLINELLAIESLPSISQKLKFQIASSLNLGAPFDHSTSLEFHRVFQERYKTYRTRILVASFLDQAFAVGLAGGVFLYSTTFWAAHGQWPW